MAAIEADLLLLRAKTGDRGGIRRIITLFATLLYQNQFARMQNALKIKPLYLKHYASYLTSKTTRVVQQH